MADEQQGRATRVSARWIHAAVLSTMACGMTAMSGSRGERLMAGAARYMPATAGMIAASGERPAPTSAPRSTAQTAPSPSPSPSHAEPAESPRAEALPKPPSSEPVVMGRRVWDAPMSKSWTADRAWTPAEEDGFARFVTRIGQGFATHACHRLDDCFMNPAVNPLYAGDEVALGFHPDCADLAYFLRSYYAFRRHLPFGMVRAMGSEHGGDPRYLRDGYPVAWMSWQDYHTPREFFRELPSAVHSGMFRLSPKIEEGDTYPVPIDRVSVRPGTVYYDTNGHVLTVVAVKDDGGVEFIDGHPDGSITYRHMTATYIAGTELWGGGFRRWRPMHLANGVVTRDRNWQLPDFDAHMQYDHARYVVNGAPARYDEWVHDRLRAPVAPAAAPAVLTASR